MDFDFFASRFKALRKKTIHTRSKSLFVGDKTIQAASSQCADLTEELYSLSKKINNAKLPVRRKKTPVKKEAYLLNGLKDDTVKQDTSYYEQNSFEKLNKETKPNLSLYVRDKTFDSLQKATELVRQNRQLAHEIEKKRNKIKEKSREIRQREFLNKKNKFAETYYRN